MLNIKKQILVVDDDEKIRSLLRRCLEADGYDVLEARNAEETHSLLATQAIDLITLDLQLGADNGLNIATEIRQTSSVPIIMVTGKGDVIDKVVGLEMGADDYISKPFHVREVQARVKSALRRSEMHEQGAQDDGSSSQTSPGNIFSFEGWKADASKHELTDPDGAVCEVTTTDFRLLLMFLNAPKRVLSRDQIMDQLNGQEWTPFDRTVDNQVARLRKKIEVDVGKPKTIKTIRGVGYMFAADVDRD